MKGERKEERKKGKKERKWKEKKKYEIDIQSKNNKREKMKINGWSE